MAGIRPLLWEDSQPLENNEFEEESLLAEDSLLSADSGVLADGSVIADDRAKSVCSVHTLGHNGNNQDGGLPTCMGWTTTASTGRPTCLQRVASAWGSDVHPDDGVLTDGGIHLDDGGVQGSKRLTNSSARWSTHGVHAGRHGVLARRPGGLAGTLRWMPTT